MAIFNIHPGSWTIPGTNIRLPDIGLTELVGSVYGQERNPQGGSQLRSGTVFDVGNVGYTAAQTPAQKYTYQTGQGIQPGTYPQYGVTTPIKTSQPTPQPQPKPQPTPTNSGGGGYITESEALARGWDVNNLPAGYTLYRPPSSAEEIERENRIRAGIESVYQDLISSLDRQAGLYNQYEQQDIGRLQEAYQTLISGIGSERQAAEQKLGLARSDVEARKKTGMEEIAQNLRNLLKATGMQLGAMGAGSSSAAEVIAPYALSKEASRAQAQVIRGANEQLAEIDRKMIDVQNVYDSEKNKVDMWLNERQQAIADTYRQLKTAIEDAKRTASSERQAALNALDISLLNNAIAQSNALEQYAINYRQQVEQWARDRLAQLDNFKLQLQQTSAFSPQDLVYSELQGIQGLPAGAEQAFYNPMALIQKRRKELGL